MAVESTRQNNLVVRSAKEEIVSESSLLERYLPLVRSRANAFHQKGVEIDDLIQEGVIGLLYAIRAYDHKFGTAFETFAYVCITNRLRSAVSTAVKKPPAISLDSCQPLEDKFWSTTLEEDPQEIIISREHVSQLLEKVNNCLSGFEHKTIRFYLSGYTYQEIAKLLQSTTKAVDNALQRARRKLRTL